MRKGITYGVTSLFVLVHPFGNDIAGTLQSFLGVFHFSLYECLYPCEQVRFVLHHHDLGKRFETFLAGYLRLSNAFGFIGKVDVFYFRTVPRVLDTLFQFGGQLPLFFYGGEDRLFSLFQLGQLIQLVLDIPDLYFIQSSGHFFPVAADERDGCTFVQQSDGSLHLSGGDVQDA